MKNSKYPKNTKYQYIAYFETTQLAKSAQLTMLTKNQNYATVFQNSIQIQQNSVRFVGNLLAEQYINI